MADVAQGTTQAAPVTTQPGQAPQSSGDPKGQATRGPDGKFLPQGSTQSQPSSGASANMVAEAAKEAKRRLKIGDQEEVDEDEVIKVYRERKGHQRAANEKFQDGLRARKQAEEFLTLMRDEQKLMDVIKKLGHDPRKLSEKYLASELETEMMDPRDRELRDAKAKLKQIEEMDKRRLEEVQQQRHEEMKAKYAKEYETQFIEALKKTNLPPTKPMVAEMAKYISRSAKIGFKMTPEEAAQLVREDIQAAHQRLIGDSDGEILLKLLGDNVANKIRKYDTDRLKTPEQVLRTPAEQGTPRSREPKKRMTPHEWRRHKMGLS